MSTQRPYHAVTALDRLLNRVLGAFSRGPTLAVRGRTTGKLHVMPVWPLDNEGKRYLVAPRGNTQWARNLRASGEGELREGGRVTRFKAVELPPEEAAAIVNLYVERNGPRYGGFVAGEFKQIPDPRDHPVFRLDEA
jgi:deazaflavin-dependent oxidoreductase (nitroreductase family)